MKKVNQVTQNFSAFLKNKIETKLKELPQVFLNCKHQEIKVACINYGYKNGNLINLLKKRGQIIGNGQYDKLEPVEEEINIILNRSDSIKEPIVAFITFST
jgi:hypothetical protein